MPCKQPRGSLRLAFQQHSETGTLSLKLCMLLLKSAHFLAKQGHCFFQDFPVELRSVLLSLQGCASQRLHEAIPSCAVIPALAGSSVVHLRAVADRLIL